MRQVLAAVEEVGAQPTDFMFLLFLLFFAIAEAQYCYFIPPPNWEIAQLKNPSPHVKIGFIGKGSTTFRPSINLATEEIDVSLKEYVKAVKELQLADPTTKWRDLGKFPMEGGTGRLTEMSTSSPWGELQVFQAFLVKEGTVYILTAAILKEDLPKFHAPLLSSFRSLTFIDDLWTPIADSQRRSEFQALFTSLGTEEGKWEKLQSCVSALAELGPYWQFLALQEGRVRMTSVEKSK